MDNKQFGSLREYKEAILDDTELALTAYKEIYNYVKILKQQGRATGYLVRFYLSVSSKNPTTLEEFSFFKIYFLNVIDDMEIIISDHFI